MTATNQVTNVTFQQYRKVHDAKAAQFNAELRHLTNVTYASAGTSVAGDLKTVSKELPSNFSVRHNQRYRATIELSFM